MPVVGYLGRQATVIEAINGYTLGTLAITGSLFVDTYYQVTPGGYKSGTLINGTVTGSITGVVVNLHKLYEIDSAGVVGFAEDTGTIIGVRVLGTGKGLGSLIGTTVASTVIAGPNTIFLQPYRVGTVTGTLSTSTSNPLLVPPNTYLTATIQVLVRGA